MKKGEEHESGPVYGIRGRDAGCILPTAPGVLENPQDGYCRGGKEGLGEKS